MEWSDIWSSVVAERGWLVPTIVAVLLAVVGWKKRNRITGFMNRGSISAVGGKDGGGAGGSVTIVGSEGINNSGKISADGGNGTGGGPGGRVLIKKIDGHSDPLDDEDLNLIPGARELIQEIRKTKDGASSK